MPYATIGTTPLISIDQLEGPKVMPGSGYYSISIVAAQAAFQSSMFERIVRLVVARREFP